MRFPRLLHAFVVVGLLLPAVALVCLSCKTPFDPATPLGSDVLRDVDPKITDLSAVIKTVDSVSVPVDTVFSALVRNATARPAGLFVYPSGMTVGKTIGHRSIAYVEFDSTVFAVKGGYTSLRSLELVLRPRAAERLKESSPTIRVDTVEVKGHDSTRFDLSTITAASLLRTGAVADSQYVNTRDDTVDVYKEIAIPLADGVLFGQLSALCAESLTTYLPYDESYALSVEDSGFVVFESVAIRAVFDHAKNDKDSIDVIEKSPAYFDVTILETDSIPATTLVSSPRSGRETILGLNLDGMYQAMVDGTDRYQSILEANLTLNVGSVATEEDDSIIVHYVLSDSLHTSAVSPDSDYAIYRNSDGSVAYLDMHSRGPITIPFEAQLQKFAENPGKDLYLYLQVATRRGTWGWVSWDVPRPVSLKLQAVFSNPRTGE